MMLPYKPKLAAFLQKLAVFMASPRAFQLIIGLFVIETSWIALTGLYPMAFDENFHLGLIRLYAQHLLPFWTGQPDGGDAYGAVARDPSYLYHFVFGYLYRLLSVFTHNQSFIVIVFRFLDIALFATGLVLFRRVLLRMKAPSSIVNLSTLGFILIPVVPLMAAQLNYDNALFALIGLVLVLCVRLTDQLQKRQSWLVTLSWLIVASLSASLVKYAFLPILVAVAVYVMVMFIKYGGGKKRLLREVHREAGQWRRPAFLIATVAAVLLVALAGERYAVNLALYHTPVPDCGQVLDYSHCSAYSPWNRNYNYAQEKHDFEAHFLDFTHEWFYGMWRRSFFAVDGPTTGFQAAMPLLLPGLVGVFFPPLALAASVLAWRRLTKRYDRRLLWLSVSIAGAYILALFVNGYKDYLHTGRAVAINGRYLMMILLPLIVIGMLAFRELLRRRPTLLRSLAAIMILALLWGGGALTYILRSNDQWYWNSTAVRAANHAVQHVIGPVVPGYYAPEHMLPFHLLPPQS